jgi:hypothetical protein|tara:strand:- start:211 stop:786 length:576 start_codon:yes stop_codon:yes gene_type:complete
MHRPTVWLPHIPRTAGQSRHEMLMHLPEYKRFDHKRNSNIPLKNNIVMGHMSVLESPDWIKILFVRDPIERFWSSFYYTQKRHPSVTLEQYIKGTNIPLHGYVHFTTTIDWLKWQQQEGKCNWQLDPYKWDYIFTIHEMDKFVKVMNKLGYNVNPQVQVNGNNIDYSKLDTPDMEKINTEYKYYTDLGITL